MLTHRMPSTKMNMPELLYGAIDTFEHAIAIYAF